MDLNAESNRSEEGLQLRLIDKSVFLRILIIIIEWKIESTSLSPVYRASIPKIGPVKAKNLNE